LRLGYGCPGHRLRRTSGCKLSTAAFILSGGRMDPPCLMFFDWFRHALPFFFPVQPKPFWDARLFPDGRFFFFFPTATNLRYIPSLSGFLDLGDEEPPLLPPAGTFPILGPMEICSSLFPQLLASSPLLSKAAQW